MLAHGTVGEEQYMRVPGIKIKMESATQASVWWLVHGTLFPFAAFGTC